MTARQARMTRQWKAAFVKALMGEWTESGRLADYAAQHRLATDATYWSGYADACSHILEWIKETGVKVGE